MQYSHRSKLAGALLPRDACPVLPTACLDHCLPACLPIFVYNRLPACRLPACQPVCTRLSACLCVQVTLGPGAYTIEETAYWSERVYRCAVQCTMLYITPCMRACPEPLLRHSDAQSSGSN